MIDGQWRMLTPKAEPRNIISLDETQQGISASREDEPSTGLSLRP